MEERGTKRVKIVAVFAGTLTGDFLPPQIIYQGTTQRCLPNVEFPEGWHVACMGNHWSNEETMMQYIDKILLPYIKREREGLHLQCNHPALVIFDNFTGQNTEQVLKLWKATAFINCTDRLQPLDINMNKAAKDFLR